MSRPFALLGALLLASLAICAMGQDWNPQLPRQFSTEIKATTNALDFPLAGKAWFDVPAGFARTDVALLGNISRQIMRNGSAYNYYETTGTEFCLSAFNPVVDPWWYLAYATRVGLDAFHKCYVFSLRIANFKVSSCLASPTIPVYQNFSSSDGPRISIWFHNVVAGPQSPFLFELPPACAVEGPDSPESWSEPDWFSAARQTKSSAAAAKKTVATEASFQHAIETTSNLPYLNAVFTDAKNKIAKK